VGESREKRTKKNKTKTNKAQGNFSGDRKKLLSPVDDRVNKNNAITNKQTKRNN